MTTTHSSAIDRKAWGSKLISSLLPPLQSLPSPIIDPSKTSLPTPFTVCVIGASRGIGAGLATSYTKAGCTTLVLASRRISGLQETAEKCLALNPRVQIHIVACDIVSESSVEALAAVVRTKCQARLDVVAINSGFSGPVRTSILDTDAQTFRQAIDVNYTGTFLAAKALIPLLLGTADGAKALVAVSSMAGFLVRGPIANAQYCVSKLAQLKLMEHVHEQFSAQGLRAFSIHPGAVATEQALATAPDEFMPFLTDSDELCGATAVWLTKDLSQNWLSGRLVSANWSLNRLADFKNEIVQNDLLKIDMGLPDTAE